jgi:biotin transport system substrate-specific component
MTTSLFNSSLSTLAPLAGSSIAKKALLVVGGSLFLAALSQVSVGEPVPQTLQTLGVMLIGLTFGFRLATATLFLYILEGAVGLPVFAGFTGGIAKIIGGTGGYLVGFVLAAALIGYLADTKFTKSWVGTIVALFAGETIIFGLGVGWLTYLYGFDKALEWGFTPFVLWDGVKLALAALIGKGVLKGAEQFAKL